MLDVDILGNVLIELVELTDIRVPILLLLLVVIVINCIIIIERVVRRVTRRELALE